MEHTHTHVHSRIAKSAVSSQLITLGSSSDSHYTQIMTLLLLSPVSWVSFVFGRLSLRIATMFGGMRRDRRNLNMAKSFSVSSQEI